MTGANTALAQLAEARDSGNLANVNKLEKDLAFNLGGHVNHSIFWTNLSPDGGDKPTGELAAAIDDHFGSFDKFQAHFTAAALGVQGSGWAVLAWDSLGQRLIIVQFFDQQGNLAGRHRPAAHARRLGARVLPRLPERARRLRQGVLEHRELGRTSSSASRPHARRPRAAATVVADGVPGRRPGTPPSDQFTIGTRARATSNRRHPCP